MLRCLLRLVAFPFVAILYILGLFVTYIVGYAGMLCRLISAVVFILAVIGWVTGLGFANQLIQMVLVGFIFFILPGVGDLAISGILQIKACLSKMLNT